MVNHQPRHTDPVPVQLPDSPTPKKKGPNKLLLAILIPLLVVAVVGGSVAAFFAFWPKDSADSAVQSTTHAHEHGHDEDDMVDLARPLIEKIQDTITTELATDYPDMTNTFDEGSAPAYLVEGYEYRFNGNFGYSTSFIIPSSGTDFDVDLTFADAATEIARTLIKEEGLSLKNTTGYEEEYQSDTLICGVSINSVPAYIRCANIWNYEMEVASVKAFADAYFKANPEITDKSLVVFGTPSAEDSINDGYKTATVAISGYDSVGGAAGLFYSVNGTWNYFVSAQSLPSCGDYDTDDLKLAYEGQMCFDDDAGTDSTVKP